MPNTGIQLQNSIINGLYREVAWYQHLKLKPRVIKQQTTNHEVLFFTNTRFSKKQFCENKCNGVDPSALSQLENACWNGMVFEILPDIIKSSSAKKDSYTWEVIPAKNFIEVKIGAVPYTVENSISLNPYLFLSIKNLN